MRKKKIKLNTEIRKDYERRKSSQDVVEYYNNTVYDLELKLSSIPMAGLGVYLSKNAKKHISKDSLIGYYEAQWQFDTNNLSSYAFFINKNVYLDIDPKCKPYTAMINDAYQSQFKNNVEAYTLDFDFTKITKKTCKMYDPNRLVKLYAIEDISPGDELFFSYGDDYW